ncbi:GroES-like protein [Fomes fomentarius]|nr:GroES-like protein [Fomes fomentarius]
MAPQTQKALIVPEAKAPWKLVTDWPVPAPGPKDVLIKVVAAAINPADWKIPTFGAPFVQYPFIGGLDGSGIIEDVGTEVTSFVKGDKVVFPGSFDPLQASFKQYTVAPADNVAKLPDNVSFEQAASVPVALATVAVAIWSHHPEASSVDFPAPWEEGGTTKFAGKAAFVIGGSSSVGQYAIQLARMQGFSPIIATSSLRHEAWLKSLGATHVVDRTLAPSAILAKLPEITGGTPIVYAYDSIGDVETQHLAYDALAADGALVVTQPFSEKVLAEKVERDGGSKKIARPFASFAMPGNKKLGEEVYARLTEWLEKGVVVPNRVEVLPGGLAGVLEGTDRMKNGMVSGTKLVVRPQETA